MKKFTFRFALIALLFSLIVWSCSKEDSIEPYGTVFASQYTSLTLDDPFDLPDPAASEQLAVKLFDLKENDGQLTQQEVLTVGDPARNENLAYALLFVEAYDRDEILWSWDEPADLEEDALDDRSHTAKWRWNGGDPIGSMWCSGHEKWPAFKVKNRFTDPCGETLEFAAVYKCCYSLCGDDLPTDCQPGCTNPSITIPAGSVDALAQAIEDVCVNGTIILAAGEHVENEGIVISKQVTIRGENGAVLKVHSEPTVDPTVKIDVALHFMGVARPKLENLTIEPLTAPGGTGVLLHGSDKGRITDCHFTDFQYTILIEQSDKVSITSNTIVCSDAWLAGVIPSALGITVVNGEKAEIKSNEVSFGLFGVWLCDKDGIYTDNYTHQNYIGMILCRVPPNAFVLPNGTPTGAEFSANKWHCSNNVSQNNFDAGYMVIDGANKNTLTNNEGGNNSTYDFDLVGDSYRFGFLTPTSSNNTVNVGSFDTVTVKDCGDGNTVNGGVIVDTGSDPCF